MDFAEILTKAFELWETRTLDVAMWDRLDEFVSDLEQYGREQGYRFDYSTERWIKR